MKKWVYNDVDGVFGKVKENVSWDFLEVGLFKVSDGVSSGLKF